MKKLSKIAMFVLLCVMLVCFVLAACDTDNNTNGKVPDIRNDHFAPVMVSLGEWLYWEPCIGAVSYDIYRGENKIANVTDTRYFVGEHSNDTYYSAVANYKGGSSDHSTPTLVSKNVGYTDDEILDLSNFNGEAVTVTSKTRKVVVKYSEQKELYTSFIIETRTTDIVFELTNATLVGLGQYGVISTPNGQYDRASNNFSIVFDVEGECGVKGLQPATPSKPAKNSGSAGDNGANGVKAVLASSVVVVGSGTMTFIGGKGQNGAPGADSDMLSSASYGHGGNGGNGGGALVCKYLLLDMQENGTLSLVNGMGGENGGRGIGATLTDMSHLSHTAAQCDGSDGSVGKSYIQISVVIGGTLNK